MITIKIKTWPAIGGVSHTATSYQVSSNNAFTNVLDNHLNDNTNLNVYYSPVVVPVNATYYVRVKRHFSNNTDSGWGSPVAVTSEAVTSGVIFYNPVKVYTPVVSVDSNQLLDPSSVNYTVTCSDFAGENEGHGYTIWVVVDDKGDIIDYVKSTTNLTSITFSRNHLRLLDTKYVKIIVIHGTLTNIESGAGSLTINITNANFTISTSGKTHSPGVDLEVSIHRSTTALDNTVTKVELSDINGTIIQEFPVSSGVDTIIMPGVLFTSDTQYLITAYGPVTTSKNSYTIPVLVRPVASLDRIDKGFRYSKTITVSDSTQRYPISGEVSGIELFNGKALVPVSSRLRSITTNADGTYTAAVNPISNTGIWAIANGGGVIRTLSNDRILVDFDNSVGASRTSVYNVDYYNNSATLQASIYSGSPDAGINNGIVFTEENVYYEAKPNTTAMYKTTINATTLSKVNVGRPSGEGNIILAARDSGNNLLVFCKDSNDIYQYNIDNDTYTKKYTLPVEFRGRTLKQVELVNGDVIVWKPIITETVNGTSVTDGVLDMLYIDNKNSVCDHIVPMIGRVDNIYTSILTNSGKVLLVTDSVSGPNVLTFE